MAEFDVEDELQALRSRLRGPSEAHDPHYTVTAHNDDEHRAELTLTRRVRDASQSVLRLVIDPSRQGTLEWVGSGRLRLKSYVARHEQELRSVVEQQVQPDHLVLLLRDLRVWVNRILDRGDAESGVGRRLPADPFHRWVLAVRLVEAVYPLLRTHLSDDLPADREARTLAARTRFLLLSEPFRHSAGSAWAKWVEPSSGVLPDEVLGLRLARAAREWQDALLRYQSDPSNFPWDARVELEARQLVWCDPTVASWRARWRRLPLADSTAASEEGARGQRSARMSGQERRHRILAREFFLPRFMLGDALVVRGSHLRVLIFAVAAVVAAAGVAAWGAWQADGAEDAALTAVAWAGLALGVAVVAGSLWLSPGVTYPLCLRIPAVAALGAAALVTVNAGPWRDGVAWPIILGMIALAYGYLVVEGRNHDLGVPAVLRRAFAVLSLGLVQSVLVASLLINYLAAEVTTRFAVPEDLASVVRLIAFVAAAGLVLGVLLQALWEARPITYPLAHLEWVDDTDT